MKQYKSDIVNEMTRRTSFERVVSLKDAAKAVGVDRLNTAEAVEVLRAAEKRTGYKALRICSSSYGSLWEFGVIADRVLF